MLRVVKVVHQQQCNGHCLCDSAQAQQLKQQLRSAQVAGQWRRDTALTLPLFWRRSTVSPDFFGRFPRSSLSLSRPLPTLSSSLIGHLASVDIKQHERKARILGVLKIVCCCTIKPDCRLRLLWSRFLTDSAACVLSFYHSTPLHY